MFAFEILTYVEYAVVSYALRAFEFLLSNQPIVERCPNVRM